MLHNMNVMYVLQVVAVWVTMIMRCLFHWAVNCKSGELCREWGERWMKLDKNQGSDSTAYLSSKLLVWQVHSNTVRCTEAWSAEAKGHCKSLDVWCCWHWKFQAKYLCDYFVLNRVSSSTFRTPMYERLLHSPVDSWVGKHVKVVICVKPTLREVYCAREVVLSTLNSWYHHS